MKAVALALAALALAGCNRGIDNKEAVRQGVIDYLNKRNMNVSSMNVSVTAVTFKQNEADATVAFAAKGGGGGGMTMHYMLEKQGGRWVVKQRSDSGQHGMQGMPGMPGAPGAPGMGQGMGEMPPGHPAVPAPKK